MTQGESKEGIPMLLGAEDSADEPRFFDAFAAAARKKLGALPEWEWWSLEALAGGDVLVEGGIPLTGRKGRARWKGIAGDKLVVTSAEKDAACAEYEHTTGNCWKCAGSGKTIASAHMDGTRTYRTCSRCDGRGEAKNLPAPPSEIPVVEISKNPARGKPE